MLKKFLNFLFVITIDGLCKHMSPVEYHTILRYCCMILLFRIDEVFSIFCKTFLDTWEHTIHCKDFSGLKHWRDFDRDILSDIFYRVAIFVKKEMSVSRLIHMRGDWHLGPYIFWCTVGYEGKYACVDFTVVGLRTEDFTVRPTTLKFA